MFRSRAASTGTNIDERIQAETTGTKECGNMLRRIQTLKDGKGLPVLPPAHQLHLPGCGGQIPCALSLMRTLAPLPSTTLSQVMSPTTTSWRLLNPTSRNPRLRMGPRMTSSTMTSPSARRSLHHCSPRSEKMMRAVDEPITLKTKVCRPVCRRPSVMIERGDPL